MSDTNDPILLACETYRNELIAAGLLVPLGTLGIYGLSGAFEAVVNRLDAYISRMGNHQNAEVIRFPPLFNRAHYLKTDHLQSFPNLMGSVHSFAGNEASHLELVRKKEEGEDWTRDLNMTESMMAPATCYSLYPNVSGTLPEGGRVFDLCGFVFRHEPSLDPARMQTFRMREYVRLGLPEQALGHRDTWLKRAHEMLLSMGLDATIVVANDPFFGRGGRVMAATQREQTLKFELVVPITSTEKPTAVMSSNYHMDHFGHTFKIKTADGQVAHSACMAFGMERITLALFKTHGFNTKHWPKEVCQVLEL
ncbi:MAG: amino acid--[acyl-carrier-protein] ligase [Nitrospirota bacterium]